VIICCLIFVTKREIVLGLVSGLALGAVNFAAIVFTVKSVVRPDAVPAGAALLTVLVYLFKLALIGCSIAALIIFRKHYSIAGFLIGFTLTLVLIMADVLISKTTNPASLDKLLL
jgi:hypothetical protein